MTFKHMPPPAMDLGKGEVDSSILSGSTSLSLPVMSRSRVAVLGAVVAASQRRRPSSSESTERNTLPRTLTALASISSRVIERDLVVGRPCDAPTCGAMGAPRPGVALGVIEKITVMGHSSRHEESRPEAVRPPTGRRLPGALGLRLCRPSKIQNGQSATTLQVAFRPFVRGSVYPA
jgi:hypothetical protein